MSAAAATACITVVMPPSPNTPVYPSDGGDQGGVGVVDGGAGTGANTGLPCDIQQLLEVRCIACHSTSMPLVTYANLMAKSTQDPTKNMAQESLALMQSTSNAMPPPPATAPTAAEIATFQAWVNAGTPQAAACTTTPTTTPDGGVVPTADSGTITTGGDSGTTTTTAVCTSGQYWTSGTGSTMAPGEACQACHQKQGGPSFSFAGTVYATLHEPKDCKGDPGPVSVTVTDANNATVTVNVDSVGNFSSQTAIAAPFHVVVTDSNGTRTMYGSLTSGDCNSCHTPTGANNAPGRIMAP